ncbi:hypothetical protein BO71DRAFT_101749 [Aspergillus ellipticus CBS 707.79]|uniref:Uncharacterized protein n=1 Tax=Aspergillus ellipticus CBS 707.79 TaxID=1448320 RepID=A0A319DJW5_9EURO|nr:hypothetical protein BO71DRAFT_101749 [Aspergillus ellipticus CBS 707.79]
MLCPATQVRIFRRTYTHIFSFWLAVLLHRNPRVLVIIFSLLALELVSTESGSSAIRQPCSPARASAIERPVLLRPSRISRIAKLPRDALSFSPMSASPYEAVPVNLVFLYEGGRVKRNQSDPLG